MKAFQNLRTGTAWLAIILVLAFSGCNNPTQEQQTTADTVKQEVTLSPEAQALLYSFPTPFEVTTMLEKAKAGFIFDIANPPANVDKYNTELAQGLNLGVYSADLAYASTYNRMDETRQFLGCTNKLADGLGIAGVYDQSLLDKVKQYESNKDSLMNLFNRVLSQTSSFLAQNNRSKVAVLIACGGFAEALYLTLSLAEVAKDNSQLMAIVNGQKDNHMKLLTILEAYNADSTMMPVLADFQKLKPIWGNYGLEKGGKIDQKLVFEMSDMAEGVRLNFIK